MANHGDVNLAGRDIHVHKHYHSYSDRVDITTVLDTIRNLRKVHLDVLSKVTPGTGAWLFKADKFLVWLDPNGNLKVLWGTGIPGAGKTVLASIVIRELEARAMAVGGRICVCYVYIRYSDRAELTVRNILEILVKQAIERHSECVLIAERAYARHLREKTQPTDAELLQLLHQFTEATFYVVDALDEASDRLQVDLVQKLASLNVRLFITSRPLKSVQARVPGACCFPIIAQEVDLDLHIAQEIARSRDLQDLLETTGPSLRDEIVSLVKSKCGGMFLRASLQLDALCECVTIREVRQTLDTFPSSIEGVYQQTWHRILQQRSHVSLAKAILVWVLNASRPMKIEELARAVATSPDTHRFEPDRLAPGTTLIALCRGLVTLEEESRLVRLVHYTAKDILQELVRDSFPHPHSHLAAVCMTHLIRCGFQNTTIRSEEEFTAARQADPLLTYASDTWAFHARESLGVKDTRQRIASFVSECSAFPAFTMPNVLDSLDILGPLHTLAMYDLPITLVFPDDIGDPNVATLIYKESPLTMASWHGHAGAATFFLSHPDVQVNQVNGGGWSAITAAAFGGHEAVVKLLIARPEIQVNLVNNKGWSALMLVASNGHTGIANLLLARPEIQINLVDINGWSALRLAAYNGIKSVVRLLLARPEIQVNLVDNRGWSALMKAARHGHKSVVGLLIAHPETQINWTNNDRQSALALAAGYGHQGVVKLFLSRPEIQVNSVNDKGRSALILAAACGHVGAVALLLEHSEIQVNLIDGNGWSALMAAAGYGHTGIVELLLARPEIQVNLVDDDAWSALTKAAANDDEDIVQLLLAHPEIQVNSIDNTGWSTLMSAAFHGCEGSVKVLLACTDIQVNLVDKNGWSALMLAAYDGHAGIVALLVAADGIDINAVGRWGTALILAVEGGHEAIVRLLLNVAHIDAKVKRAEDGHTALSIAMAKGHEDIVRLLIDSTHEPVLSKVVLYIWKSSFDQILFLKQWKGGWRLEAELKARLPAGRIIQKALPSSGIQL